MSERFTVEVTLTDDAMPDDEDTRERAKRAAGEAVADVLTENYAADVEHTSAGFSHQYAMIDGSVCPDCGTYLDGSGSPSFSDNGALVSAYCGECEVIWYQNYRMIDLERSNGASAVAAGKTTPEYVSYPNAEADD